jgi:dihydroorotate dehydrogenase
VENQFPLIGVGGVENAATAFAKIEAGASLVQFYTSMTYRGLTPLSEIKRGILRRLVQNGQARLREAVGTRAKEWADGGVAH